MLVFSNLDIVVSYEDSGKSFVIQTADLLAGKIRKTALDNMGEIHQSLLKFVDFKIVLP